MHDTPFDRLRRDSHAYQAPCVLMAAAELDLFTALLDQGNSMTARALAAKCGTDPRCTAVLLDALAAMEYLEKSGTDDAVYAVPAALAELLDSRHPASFIPMLRHLACVQRSWAQLARTVKNGTPTPVAESILGAKEDGISFIMAMNSIARILAGPTVEHLEKAGLLDFGTTAIRFIDIGGASGTYTQAFLQALPQAHGAVFDRPVGIQAARNRFAGSPFEARVSLHEGDFYNDPLPSGFNFAWISAVIHQMSLPETEELFKKTFAALLPGGRILVRDFIMDSSRTRPLDGALFGVNMLNTPTGMVYTFAEVSRALHGAGFANIRLALPEQTMSAVVAAEKPK